VSGSDKGQTHVNLPQSLFWWVQDDDPIKAKGYRDAIYGLMSRRSDTRLAVSQTF